MMNCYNDNKDDDDCDDESTTHDSDCEEQRIVTKYWEPTSCYPTNKTMRISIMASMTILLLCDPLKCFNQTIGFRLTKSG